MIIRMTRQAAILIAIAATSPDRIPDLIDVFPFGVSQGRDGRGPYRFDAADAARVVAASTALMLGGDSGRLAPIDFDHALHKSATGEAAGWITGYAVGPNGLQAQVEWSDAGRAALAGRRYRFLSPVFLHTPDGRLLAVDHVSLTNTPNLTGLAQRAIASTMESKMDLKAILSALGLPEDADDAAVIVKLAELQKPPPAADPAPAPLADPAPVPVPAAEAAASADVIARLAALERQLTEQRHAGSVDAAIAAGRFLPAQRAALLAVACTNPAAWDALVAASPENNLSVAIASAGAPPRPGSQSPEAAEVARQLGLEVPK